jgi:hypothetical protein
MGHKPHHPEPESDTFFQRRVDYAKKHPWWHGALAAAGVTLVGLMVTSAWNYCSQKADILQAHYHQSDLNTVRIEQLEIGFTNMDIRQRRLWETNRDLQNQINQLK